MFKAECKCFETAHWPQGSRPQLTRTRTHLPRPPAHSPVSFASPSRPQHGRWPHSGASGPRASLNVWLPGGLPLRHRLSVFTLGGSPGSPTELSSCLSSPLMWGHSHLTPTIKQAQNSDPVGTWRGARPLPQVSVSRRFDSPRLPDRHQPAQGLPGNLCPKGPQALSCQGYDSGLVACEGLWLEQSKPPVSAP